MSERDLKRLTDLTRRLEELCEEGEEIRARIRELAENNTEYPARRPVGDLFKRATVPSPLLRPDATTSDTNQGGDA